MIVPSIEEPNSILLTDKQVATLLSMSSRTIRRLSDAGKMPLPLRIGGCVRWRKIDIERWIANGCPVKINHHG